MNEAILSVLPAFSKDKGYRFTPIPRDPQALHINPRDPEYDGVSKALYINDTCIAKNVEEGVTYCCGVSFEAWFDALTVLHLPPASLFPSDQVESEFLALVSEWFCPVMGHSGCVSALLSRGWGQAVSLQEAQAGDLCQFWRSVALDTPSGHSVVFLEYDEATRRLRYWSSQRATNGAGEHCEEVGEGWQVHVVRPLLPSAVQNSSH